MRALFFRAVAEHSNIAEALSLHADSALRPFDQYLRQAIHTAKKRQIRYKLPWERVRQLRHIELQPLDSRVRIPRESPRWRIVNWPEGKVPDVSQQLMIVNRGLSIRVEAWDRDVRGLAIRTSEPLDVADRVFWCGVDCQLEPETSCRSPKEVADQQGQRFDVVRAEEDGEDAWLVVVRGRPEKAPLHVDGQVVEVQFVDDFEGIEEVVDANGRSFALQGRWLKVEELPTGHFVAEGGLRFGWKEKSGQRRDGLWIQLLLPADLDAEEFLDPRAAFCEDEVTEVWTQRYHRPDTVIKVKRVDRDRYQLLVDRLPPPDAELHLPLDVRNLELQRRALRQLREAPLPHHRGLLRLCENVAQVRWPDVRPVPPERWYFLTDLNRSGTDEQRDFVAKALGSPDLALLEGPPGSGKTTAICELIRQCIERGERVLLCASTHVAIDNVLERMLGESSPVDAVRIGRVERVDIRVRACQLDERVEMLRASYRDMPEYQALGDEELRAMAERTIIMAANLTCGTTMGIVNHPLFRGRDQDLMGWERPITTMLHWDVLIVDEASKTTIQEFMVPAMMARRHVIVGDIHQLPPFTDRADIAANLRTLVDDQAREIFPADRQRAQLLLFHLARPKVRKTGARWLIVEPPGVLDALVNELGAKDLALHVIRVVAGRSHSTRIKGLEHVLVDEIQRGHVRSLWLAGADWVLVGADLIEQVAAYLPANLLSSRGLLGDSSGLSEAHPLFFRTRAWQARAGLLAESLHERGTQISSFTELEAHERDWLERHDWAIEVTWRLTRLHELRDSRNRQERGRLNRDIDSLLPSTVNLKEQIEEIQDIGLPSIIEVLQGGIGQDRARRRSALTEGLRAAGPHVFDARFRSLSYQHRMHAEIADLPRELIYGNNTLRDANTIGHRDANLGWDFAPGLRSRRVWIDVRGRESAGVNTEEVAVMERLLREFLDWAKRKGSPKRERPRQWEVACLCFYLKQERAIREMLRRVTGLDRETRFDFCDVEIVGGVVDRFQGREADLVLLSMRNTRRTGFLDSPNRLNVAITRARQQLVVIGNASYFVQCGIEELEQLAKRTPHEDGRKWANLKRVPGRLA